MYEIFLFTFDFCFFPFPFEIDREIHSKPASKLHMHVRLRQ